MDTLRPLASGLWVADRRLPLGVGDIGTRMTVIRLADGGLFVHSPVRLDAQTRQALDALEPIGSQPDEYLSSVALAAGVRAGRRPPVQ